MAHEVTTPNSSSDESANEKVNVEESDKSQQENGEVETENPETVEESDDGRSDGSEVFIVDGIEDHKWENSALKFKVRWKGYPLERDRTWEPESSLKGGARETVEEYFRKIGGRPKPASKKRSRKSTSTPSGPKRAKKGRQSKGRDSASPVVEEDFEENWSPGAEGSWENDIDRIDTIQKETLDLKIFILWKNGRKSKHNSEICLDKCPRKMCEFFMRHLVFSDKTVSNAESSDDQL